MRWLAIDPHRAWGEARDLSERLGVADAGRQHEALQVPYMVGPEVEDAVEGIADQRTRALGD